MTKKLLISLNWLAVGILSWGLVFAAVMPSSVNSLDWITPGALIILTIGLILLINGLQRLVRALSEHTYRWLLIGTGILIIVVQIWVGFHFISAAYADDFFIRNQAISLAQGNHVWNNYFKVYPNNVNTALLEAFLLKPFILLKIKMPWAMLNCVRFMWMDTGLISGLVILKHWRYWQPSGLMLMFTWLFSIPVYNYALFPYNDPFVMPLVLDIAALGLVFKTTRGWLRWLAGIGSWLLLSFGILVKSNLVVFWIAIVIILSIASFSKRMTWGLSGGWIMGSLIVLFLGNLLLTDIANNSGYVKDHNQATPVTSWVAMSLNPQRHGEYVTEDFLRIRDTAHTATAKKKVAADMIHERVKVMGVSGLAIHFYEKMNVFYSHGDFNAINLTPQWIKQPISFIHHQRAYKFIAAIIAQCWYLALLVGAIWQLLTQRRHLLMLAMLSLVMIGFTMFHVLFWEVKARYALPLLPIIYLLGCSGWSTMPVLSISKKQKWVISWLTVAGILFCSLSIADVSRRYSVLQNSIVKQDDNTYFQMQRLKIKPLADYRFTIPTNNLVTNQLVLYPQSNTHATITIRAAGKVLKRVSGSTSSGQLKTINYPQVKARELHVTIQNRSKHAVNYSSGVMRYSPYTGGIKTKPRMYMRYNANFTYPVHIAPNGDTSGTRLMSFTKIIIINFLFLILILVSVWWDPRSVAHLPTRQRNV